MTNRCSNCGKTESEKKPQSWIHFYGRGKKDLVACADCDEFYYDESEGYRQEQFDQMKADNQCRFYLAYIGYCREPGYPLCEKHKKERPCGCGKPATGQCPVAGSFVCGVPICDDHVECLRHGGALARRVKFINQEATVE